MGIARQSIEDLKKRSKISDFILATTSRKLRAQKDGFMPISWRKTASMSFTDVETSFIALDARGG